MDLQTAAFNLGKAFSVQQPRPGKGNRQQPSPPAASPPERRRSRTPRRKDKGSKHESHPPAPSVEDKMQIWAKLQGIAKPEEPKEEPKVEEKRIGWLPEGEHCVRCGKSVVEQGGIYCGRKRPNGECVGCFEGICWKCMNKAGKKEFGNVKTSKTEFASLGADAWWMHEKCMSPEDKRSYFGEDDEEEDQKKAGSDDEGDGKFLWM
mmetsp:Transcript_36028/g.53798  ORF Transcript_36028/g.53798 Transcript_36028/m.53798 type:complete len:206 (-) Transcript_36028:287-904(-)